jgi:hypothetical protein
VISGVFGRGRFRKTMSSRAYQTAADFVGHDRMLDIWTLELVPLLVGTMQFHRQGRPFQPCPNYALH